MSDTICNIDNIYEYFVILPRKGFLKSFPQIKKQLMFLGVKSPKGLQRKNLTLKI
jgi:hypothetical protein